MLLTSSASPQQPSARFDALETSFLSPIMIFPSILLSERFMLRLQLNDFETSWTGRKPYSPRRAPLSLEMAGGCSDFLVRND
jgi:hypothetical protein